MLRNYLKIAWRNIARQPGYSFINIFGLALGMAVAMLIGLWVYDELSFNQNFKNYDRIARVWQNQTYNGEIKSEDGVPLPLAGELRETYGDNFKYVALGSWNTDHLFEYKDKKITQPGQFMEADITKILSLNMVEGNVDNLSDNSNSILLSKSLSEAIFGNEPAINKIIKLDDQSSLKVEGIYEDFPSNSQFSTLKFIGPWGIFKSTLPEWISWGNNWFQMYVEINENSSFSKISETIKLAKINKVDEDQKKFKSEVFLHPMSKWHLYSQFENGVNSGGRITFVWIFGIIGSLVLLLACINFINLVTAQSEKRSKEVGLRKAVGSQKKQLVFQFLLESMLISAISFGVAILLSLGILPIFNEVAEKELILPFSNLYFWGVAFLIIVFTGFLAGLYPSFYLSSFRAVSVLKGTYIRRKSSVTPRRLLVVFQYTVSIALIIGTIIIFRQVQFAKNRPIGYEHNNIITFGLKSDKIQKHFETIRQELINSGTAEEVAATDNEFVSVYNTNGGLGWRGKDPNMADQFVTLRVTPEFGKMVKWTISEGRDFSTELDKDSSGFILNEAAVKYMGFENPIGEMIEWAGSRFQVIGVCKNMVQQSIYDDIKPAFYVMQSNRYRLISVKINPKKSASNAIKEIENVYAKFETTIPFTYKFMDEEFGNKFAYEERVNKLILSFAILTIIISCLGLFGLASFTAEQRTKEIGIRKVLGATVTNVWAMLSKEFLVLGLISLTLAIPIAWYFMSNWLQTYTYRTEISPWVFTLTAIGVQLIILGTVSYQSIKAALMNPVKSLRSE